MACWILVGAGRGGEGRGQLESEEPWGAGECRGEPERGEQGKGASGEVEGKRCISSSDQKNLEAEKGRHGNAWRNRLSTK